MTVQKVGTQQVRRGLRIALAACVAATSLAVNSLPLGVVAVSVPEVPSGGGDGLPDPRGFDPGELEFGAADGDSGGLRVAALAGPYLALAPAIARDEASAIVAPEAPVFREPFEGEYRASNLFDHDVPKEFVDTNGRFTTYWGENMRVGIDGHSGYDWVVPEGTPLRAAAGGTVVFAGETAPSSCPILGNRTVVAKAVTIQHVVPIGGESLVIQSVYFHLSRVDVAVGQSVAQGAPIGLSGNTGCSTGPHLHFEVRRRAQSGRFVPFDPYGWSGVQPDPWAATQEGAQSLALWERAPQVYSETRLNPETVFGNSPVDVMAVRWIGPHDELNPNNEFVELAVDPRFAKGPVDLTGYTLRNNADDTFAFPAGFVIQPDRVVRVYSGIGMNTADTLYWGRTSGRWDNFGDCARLIDARGGTFRVSTGKTCK